MDALSLLTTRRSTRPLGLPAPDEAQLEAILQAATQVPDHGLLTPWRFVVIEGEAAKARFHALLNETVTQLNYGEETRKKADRVAAMAPLVIAVISTPETQPPRAKPVWEQQASAACAAYAAQLAAKAQGFDNVWITGLWVNSPLLREAMHCRDEDKIMGLLMIGTAGEGHEDTPKNTDLSALVERW
ncbi:nitroreductase [Neisseria sp. HSC-16F19]|nr:nitroreductase family protein [Neisseria sp. HSC-16F19]MCP2040483.1 nitroreductase [Neisseria sp. HSC-16F19]